MLKKVLALLGAGDDDDENVNDAEDSESCEDLTELEEGDWVIISVHEENNLAQTEADPLENLLIEHPSMSVYQLRGLRSEDEELGSSGEDDDDDQDSARPVPAGRSIPCRGVILRPEDHFRTALRARDQVARRTLTRTALCRQNLTKTRFCPAAKRYGYFKQPCQRIYNF
ncbi:hypothetical protein GJAV_G00244540 [Gymnothorax javanicus]|nr:hypothetical protein GJAV_G00244540 [Gymnothorax javanicus]